MGSTLQLYLARPARPNGTETGEPCEQLGCKVSTYSHRYLGVSTTTILQLEFFGEEG